MARYDDDLHFEKIDLWTNPTGQRYVVLRRVFWKFLFPYAMLLMVAFIFAGLVFAASVMLGFNGNWMVVVALLMIPLTLILTISDVFWYLRTEFGSLNPRDWLHEHNAYGVVHIGQPMEKLAELCGDICIGRWRRDDNYVYFEHANDAVAYRLSRPW